ncbi:hypothetical protein Tco_0968316 [Tanacetum coccineum]
MMSSPNHLTSGIEDAFSSNFPNIISASPYYVPASPGKTSSSSSNSFSVVPIASPTLSLFHNDPYMNGLQAFYAEESPIPPPTIEPPSSMPNPPKFYLPEGLLMPPKNTSTSEAPAMTQAAIRKLVADSVTSALEAQASTMANTSNPNKNTGPTGTPDCFQWRFLRDGSILYIYRDPLRRLCHRLIAVNILGRGQAPKKVTDTDLFYLRSMDEGTTIIVPYLLAQYLFRHTEGRKRGARMSSGHSVGCLAEHFGLRICERLGDTWAWVAPRPKRQQVVAAGVAQADQEIPEEGVQADPTPVQAPQISEKARILELKRRNMKITVLTPNTPYSSRKIWRICSCTSLKTTKETRSIRLEDSYEYAPENCAHFESEKKQKEAIHLILTGIGDEIYSTVDACQTAHEMWEAIERLQQGESLNIQDVKKNLFWEFGQFTLPRWRNTWSYYTRISIQLMDMNVSDTI